MPYITFNGFPQSLGVGRTSYDGALDPQTGEYVCIVDEVMEGEKETTGAQHAAVVAAAQKAVDQQAEADAASQLVADAARQVVADREAAVQAEMRAMAEERLAKKGI